jgi:uncharacterized protein YegJ (DUF2314 family)
MRQAVEQAKATWPRFVESFESRDEEATYAVKAAFRDGAEVEVMWAKVTGMEGGTVFGRLDNEPNAVRNVKCGDIVRIAESDVVDWVCRQNNAVHGGYTIKALAEIPSARRREA